MDDSRIKQAFDRAFQYEAERGSCAQCVYASLMETFDIGDESTFQAADALAGGTSLSTKGTCGALAGGMLILGSLVGRDYASFSEGKRKRKVFHFSRKLYDRFISEYGSPVCRDVQAKIFGRSFDLLDKEEYAAFEAAGAHVDKCPQVSGNVACWVAELLIDDFDL